MPRLQRLIPVMLATAMLRAIDGAQSIGLVTDTSTGHAILFDADSYQSLGSVVLPAAPSGCFGDCVISRDGTLAYVSGLGQRIFVIDLTTRPPTPAAGINLIPISKPGGDLDVTPDGRFLVIGGIWVMTIDLESRSEVDVYDASGNAAAVEAAPDGSVLITVPSSLALRRLAMTPDGELLDSGESINVLQSFDVDVARGGVSGLAATRDGKRLRSFTMPPLSLVETRSLTEDVAALALTPAGDRAYLRTLSGLEAYRFDPFTAQLGAEPLFRLPLPYDECTVDSIALHPDGTRLFVPAPGQVLVADPHDGHAVGRVTDPQMVSPHGLYVRSTASRCLEVF